MPDQRFFISKEPITVSSAAALANAALADEGTRLVSRAAALCETDLSGAVVFAESKKALELLASRDAGLCLCRPDDAAGTSHKGALATHESPKRAFAIIAAHLHQVRPGGLKRGTHASAKIGKDARLHETAVIDEDAVIGDRAHIGPHAYIGPGVVIGPDCEIGASVSIICALVGARARILSGARIGEAGFGFVETEGTLMRMPQLGRVLIGDDVEIGSNSTVDRGALADTVIEDGVKIDNLVQVGHNVRIGKGSALAAQVGVSGSTTIGAGVLLGGQAGLADHLTIGDGARIAAQAGLMRNVPPGEHWGGTPARLASLWFRETAALTKLAARKKTKNHENSD